MAVTYDQVRAIKSSLEDDCSQRHETLRKLRAYFAGNYWAQAGQSTDTLTTIFRDLVGDQMGDLGPDIKVVNNLLFAIITKYQSFLSSSPMIRMYVDPPGSTRQRNQATLKERYLYGTWAEGKMTTAIGQMAWYLPLMGHAFLGAFPEVSRHIVCPVLRSPEIAFPIPNYDGTKLDAVVFCWEARESVVRRSFPNYVPQKPGRSLNPLKRRSSDSDPKVWIYEYSDEDEWVRFVEGQKVNGVEHQFGFNLFDQAKFIDVPGERWGHGAVEQIVNQVELGNALESLLFQAVIDNVFPSLVLEDPSKAPETIERGPGSVIGLNPGGKAYYLNAPVNMQAGLGMLAKNEQDIKQNASMPDVSMGNFRASIVTGKAVNELQGAGTGSTVEMVQSNMGPALVGFNEKAIYIGQTMFRDEQILLQGYTPQTSSDINPKMFGFKAKGRELVGSARNEVVFQPLMDLQTKTVMNLQLRGAGLVSKQYMREQVGIPDSQAMEEEILAEAVSDAVMGFIIQSLDPSNPVAAETAGDGWFESGLAPKGGAAPQPGTQPPGSPPPGVGAPPPPEPQGTLLQSKLGSQGASATSSSQTMLPPPEQTSSPQPQGVTVEQATAAIQALGDTPGRVFLVGDIVVQGATVNDVDVAVTDQASIGIIQQGVQFPTSFTVLHGNHEQPNEEFVEVTPGTDPQAGGSPPQLVATGA